MSSQPHFHFHSPQAYPLTNSILRLRINKFIHLLGIAVPPCQGIGVLRLRLGIRMQQLALWQVPQNLALELRRNLVTFPVRWGIMCGGGCRVFKIKTGQLPV